MRTDATPHRAAPKRPAAHQHALRLPDIRRRLRSGRRSHLARACGAAPGLRVHDALAGWGTDGLVLAALGCVVHMSERNTAVFAVLEARVEQSPWGSGATCALEDARQRWRGSADFDVVYLDPMFGAHPKGARSAQHMQRLAALAHPLDDGDIAELVALARGAATSRVVVKRRGDAAAVAEPDWTIRGRSVRFDVYRP